MYNVSAAYRTAMMAATPKKFKLRGTIGEATITEDNILAGSLSVTNQICEGDDIVIGSVYTAELVATIIGLSIQGDEIITLEEGLEVTTGVYEYVPVGSYIIQEANITEFGIDIKAYDNMVKFDKALQLDTSVGTTYDLLSLICTSCNVTLGMTLSEIQALPNGTTTYQIYSENDMETYRDLLYWVAQACASYATINRTGALVLRPYSSTPVNTITDYHRVSGASFSKYVTKYSGVSVTNLEDQTTSYYGLTVDEDLTYNLGGNPLLQYVAAAEKERVCRNILNAIQAIEYTPFTSSTIIGAAYDLGDVLEFTDGILDDDIECCITSYNWKYNVGIDLEGVGKNPATANARSKTDKVLQGILNNTKSDEMRYYLYTNASRYVIADGAEQAIIDVRFASLKATTVIFQAEILMDVDTTVDGVSYDDLVLTAKYIYNESEILEYHPKETYVAGDHMMHLMYYFEIQTAYLNHLVVKLTTDGGSVTINPLQIKCTIYGQGLAATEGWDGLLNFEDSQDLIENPQTIGVLTYSETITAELLNNTAETLSDIQARVTANAETGLQPITDSLSAYFAYPCKLDAVNNLPTYDASAVDIVNNAFVVKSGATVPQSLIKTLINTQITIAAIQNVQMTLTNCTFKFSPDGVNWYVYYNEDWVTLANGMAANDVAALTSTQWLALVTSGRLDVEIIMTDSNSTVTEFSIDYLEDIT